MDSPALGILVQLLTVLALVFANGFFVAAEFSLVTIRRSRVEQLVHEGRAGARLVEHILKDLDTVISATQLGITMASLALGWVAEPALAHIFEPILSLLPGQAAAVASHSLSAALAFATVTYLHIVLGELAPKSLALQRAESTALAVAAPMHLFSRILHPFILLLNGSGNLVLRLIGTKGPERAQLVHSEEELRIILQESEKEGVLEEQETEMIERVFKFTDTTARQIMVPRTEMVCLPLSATLEEALDIILPGEYTRLPVYRDGLDDIVGYVHIHDIMRAVCGKAGHDFSLQSIMRPPLLVPETIHVDDLLNQFHRNKVHMAILVDEFGGTAGLVTLQDLLEEIVGDVSDGVGDDELAIEPQADGSFLVNGKIRLQDINDRFDLNLQDPNYVTLGGLVLGQIGRRPKVGDEVTVGSVHLRVEAVDGLRVALVRLRLPERSPSADEDV